VFANIKHSLPRATRRQTSETSLAVFTQQKDQTGRNDKQHDLSRRLSRLKCSLRVQCRRGPG